MNNDAINARLAAWQNRLALVSRNLGEINEHPAVLRMRARRREAPGFFTGETAARVDATLAALDELWKDYLLLNATVDEAESLHKQSGLFQSHDAEIRALLDGPSIALPARATPLAERGLLSTAERREKATPDELLAAMEKIFAIVKETVLAFDQAETALAPKIAALTEEARALAHRAKIAGEPDAKEIDALAERVKALGGELAANPFGAGAKLAETTDALEHWRGRLDAGAQQRAALGAGLVKARESWKQLQEISRRARAAHERACAEIVDPIGLLQPTDATIIAQFGAWLDAIEATLKSGNWRAAKAALDKWVASRDTRLQAERRIYSANSVPLAARDELRGRLDALGVKADAYAARGVRFAPAVTRLVGEAKTALGGPRVDLRQAASLVYGYEAALNHAIRGD
jgi:hypothetical protein